MKNSNTKVELLAPVGDMEKLKTALHFGADAVYFAGKQYGLRAMATNFTEEQMIEAVTYTHSKGKKAYVTINVFARNNDFDNLKQYLSFLQQIKVDAVIVSDLGLFNFIRQNAPSLEIHISTQANTTNKYSAKAYQELGASRVVLARELSIDEIKQISDFNPTLELECFIHGAMCISYSGRCLLSNYLTGRDSNHGECVQACRWKYYLVEESRLDQPFELQEDDKGAYILNSKDMCLIDYIDKIIEAGVNSFKIEGRMKTALYVATVARTYRKAIDDYFESPEKYQANMPWYLDQISNCTYRQFTTGFFYGKPSEEAQIYDSNTYLREYTYLGIVGEQNEEGLYQIEQRNKFSVGEEIEVMKPNGENVVVTVKAIQDEKGAEMESAPHPQQILYIDLGQPLERYDILRRKEE